MPSRRRPDRADRPRRRRPPGIAGIGRQRVHERIRIARLPVAPFTFHRGPRRRADRVEQQPHPHDQGRFRGGLRGETAGGTPGLAGDARQDGAFEERTFARGHLDRPGAMQVQPFTGRGSVEGHQVKDAVVISPREAVRRAPEQHRLGEVARAVEPGHHREPIIAEEPHSHGGMRGRGGQLDPLIGICLQEHDAAAGDLLECWPERGAGDAFQGEPGGGAIGVLVRGLEEANQR